MKKQLLISILFVWALALSAKERVIENPHFHVSTHGNVLVEKVTLTNEATLLHMLIWHSPHDWIRIDSNTYIQVGDEKLIVESADGIELDKEVYSDATNRTCFVLKFPAIDPQAKTLDFIESDCDDCFKIWGINLDASAAPTFAETPQHIKNLAIVKDDGKSLDAPKLKAGVATLKGHFLGYIPSMNFKIEAYVNNPVTGEQEELNAKVEKDGSFELKAPLVSTMGVLLRFSNYNKFRLLSPGEESVIYIDLHQKSYQETSNSALKLPASRYLFWGGANAEINNQLEELDLSQITRNAFYSNKVFADILGMDASSYKAYMISQRDKALQALSERKLTKKTRELVEIELNNSLIHELFFAESNLMRAYGMAHNVDYEEARNNFKKPTIDLDYYSFLKDLNLNDPINLYSGDFGGNINSSRYIRGKSFSVLRLKTDFYQKLINSGNLTPEETETAEHMMKSLPENWDRETVGAMKKSRQQFAQLLIDSVSMPESSRQLADRMIALCNNPTADIYDISDCEIELQHRLIGDGLVSEEKLSSFYRMFDFNVDIKDELLPEERQKRVSEFFQKHNDGIKAYHEENSFREIEQPLSQVLGVSEGILFDMIKTQMICRKFEEYTPLTANDLVKLKQIRNPFYLQYATEKNNQLVAKLEERKGQINYTIHNTPDSEGEQLFTDIIKPFEGKVILVDFWATWCGPCRSAMKQFEPAKKELKEKGVVFVYLTDESSPQQTWENMIGDISGEHFRMTSSQFKELKNKFGADGVPSYLILNKKGEQVYFKVGFEGVGRISQLLGEELEK